MKRIKRKLLDLNKANPEDVSVLVFNYDKSEKDSFDVEFGLLLARLNILKNQYCYTPSIHNGEIPKEALSLDYYVDRGIGDDFHHICNDFDNVNLKCVSLDPELNELLLVFNSGKCDLSEVSSYLENTKSDGLYKARRDFTSYLFDYYNDIESISKLGLGVDLDNSLSDVDLCFNERHASRLRSFSNVEFSIFDKIMIESDLFYGSDLYEMKKTLGLSNDLFFRSESKGKEDLLNGSFTFDDVYKIRPKEKKERSLIFSF